MVALGTRGACGPLCRQEGAGSSELTVWAAESSPPRSLTARGPPRLGTSTLSSLLGWWWVLIQQCSASLLSHQNIFSLTNQPVSSLI